MCIAALKVVERRIESTAGIKNKTFIFISEDYS
jgi:hypothetical protein